MTILAIDTDGVEGDAESRMLGTDFMFITAFLGIVRLIFFHTTTNLNEINQNNINLFSLFQLHFYLIGLVSYYSCASAIQLRLDMEHYQVLVYL